jgi:hypothetical protein
MPFHPQPFTSKIKLAHYTQTTSNTTPSHALIKSSSLICTNKNRQFLTITMHNIEFDDPQILKTLNFNVFALKINLQPHHLGLHM